MATEGCVKVSDQSMQYKLRYGLICMENAFNAKSMENGKRFLKYCSKLHENQWSDRYWLY